MVETGSARYASPLLLRTLRQFGEYEIVGMKLCRFARIRNIEKYEQGDKSLTYDQLFDTYLLLLLANERTVRISKAPSVAIAPASWNPSDGTEEMQIELEDDNMSLGALMADAEHNIGADRFWSYIPKVQTNRQFLAALLQAAGTWTRKIEAFLMGLEERSRSRTSRR